jgi:hypothetical protein
VTVNTFPEKILGNYEELHLEIQQDGVLWLTVLPHHKHHVVGPEVPMA